MPTRDPVDLQNANMFISKALTGDQKSRLALALTQAAAVIAETGASLDSAIYDLTIAAEDSLYEEHLAAGRETDIMTQPPIQTRTTADPHAIKPLSDRTIENRRNSFLKVYQHLTKSKDSPQQPYTFIKDVDACVAAVCACWASHGSWSLNAYAFANCVESLGEHELSQEYKRRFREMEATRKKTKAPAKTPLTLDELASIHKCADSLGQQALKLVQDTPDIFQPSETNALGVVQHALVLLLVYGTDKKWSNQRRAALSYQFKSPSTDVTVDNFIDCSAESVKLCVRTATKVKKTVTINVTEDCPLLAELLRAIEASKDRPEHLLFTYSYRQRKSFGRPLAHGSNLNVRLKDSLKHAGLSEDLRTRACGVNAARHADVKANRKRPALTTQQRRDDTRKSRKRLSSVNAAETQYDQLE